MATETAASAIATAPAGTSAPPASADPAAMASLAPKSLSPSPAAALQPPTPASAPLRLDAHVLREAHRASKSPMRQLADASGAYTSTGPVSKEEKLAQAVADTGKPDCVGKDSGGAGLLSPIVMVYLAVRGQCK
jgi:hypothetical protein